MCNVELQSLLSNVLGATAQVASLSSSFSESLNSLELGYFSFPSSPSLTKTVGTGSER